MAAVALPPGFNSGSKVLPRNASFGDYTDPGSIGFDASVEFAPDFGVLKPRSRSTLARVQHQLRKAGLVAGRAYADDRIYEYESLAAGMASKPAADYTRLRCV